MKLKIGIDCVRAGVYELTYQHDNGPVCLGPDGSPTYPTRGAAEDARAREIAAMREWDCAGLSDAPHLDAI